MLKKPETFAQIAFREQIAAEMRPKREAEKMKAALAIGAALGVAISAVLALFGVLF